MYLQTDFSPNAVQNMFRVSLCVAVTKYSATCPARKLCWRHDLSIMEASSPQGPRRCAPALPYTEVSHARMTQSASYCQEKLWRTRIFEI